MRQTVITRETIEKPLWEDIQLLIGRDLLGVLDRAADETGVEIRLIGGAVRDLIIDRPTTDLDFVLEGDCERVADRISELLGKGSQATVFRNFRTAQVKYRGRELEFVGARRESYTESSRKPEVMEGTFAEDEARRDFTINVLSVTVTGPDAGTLHDPYDGLRDLSMGIIRTPLDPDITFSDDPLRMMRAVRFAAQLRFTIPPDMLAAIRRNADRLRIVSADRIEGEFMKIMASRKPSVGLDLMYRTGLMDIYLPEVSALQGAETQDGVGHKDNFYHTIQVVDNVAERSDSLRLRMAALFHDIGKPRSKQFVRGGWTFHNHDYLGQRMLPKIFRRAKFPTDERLKYVRKMVSLHMRPAQLADDGVTDSAVRRLLFDAGDDIEDLMLLCESDLTSKNPRKVERYLNNFAIVREKLKEIEEKDRIRNFQPPVDGREIMYLYGLEPCSAVGQIKEAIKNAILDGLIHNDRREALRYMEQWASDELGLTPQKPLPLE